MKKNVILWDNWPKPEPDDKFADDVVGQPMLVSPVQHHPSTEYLCDIDEFDFRIMHTNFNITGDVAEVIEGVDGVETLEIFTRYRARVGIGKCFVFRDVRDKIATAVNLHLEKPCK